MTRYIASLAFLLSLSSCGGPAGGPAAADAAAGGQADAEAAADETTGEAASAAFLAWRQKFHAAGCARTLRCVSPPPYASQEACLDDLDGDLLAAEPRIAASILAGHTSYHADPAAACLSKYEESCDIPFTDILIVCNEVYDGELADGAACVGHFECPNPEGSDRSLCFDECTPLFGYEPTVGSGVCVPESPIGTPACD